MKPVTITLRYKDGGGIIATVASGTAAEADALLISAAHNGYVVSTPKAEQRRDPWDVIQSVARNVYIDVAASLGNETCQNCDSVGHTASKCDRPRTHTPGLALRESQCRVCGAPEGHKCYA